MVNRNDTNTPRRSDNIHRSESTQTRQAAARRETPQDDDMIMSLANSYENKRARQVTEWELMRRVTRLDS